jgi:hypothetical protein
MFRMLAPFEPPNDLLSGLGKPGGPMEDGTKASGDNKSIPAGFTYLGQFIDHDITFDPISKMAGDNDPDSLHNFRTPRYDLDSVYGLGQNVSPFLYNQRSPDSLLTAKNGNDENILISQMQVAFIHFHNRLVDHLREKPVNFNAHKLPGENEFDTAQRLARWHYQWIVVHDFLPHICGQSVVDSLLTTDAQGKPVINNVLYQPTNNPFIPVEFSVAAYRFGHSMIRSDYQLNDIIFANIFGRPRADPLSHLGGGRILPDFWQIKWPLFFKFPRRPDPQPSRKINSKLARPLLSLPPSVLGAAEHKNHPGRRSLASRNLLRGKALELPSGQAVASEMGETPLTNQAIGLTDPGWGGEAPLWFYILMESGRAPAAGARLGPVGGRIVAEVLLGLLKHDPASYVNHSSAWKPKRPIARVDNRFTFPDLVRFAEVIEGDTGPGG